MIRKRWVAAATVAAAAWAAPAASAETVYGLTDSDDLVVFDSATPGTTSPVVDVTLPAGVTSIKGIDFRPATLQLYGFGQNGQLFKIDVQTGATTNVGGTQTLTGTNFDIDFNPVIDRLRVVSDNEESLVVNPNTGGAATVGAAINPAGNVTGAAYTNNAPASAATDSADAGLLPDAPTTTLLDIDTGGTDRLASQNVTTGALTTVGNLGVDLVGDVGFDISTANTTGTGAIGANTGYVVGRTADTLDKLYTINLTSGAAGLGIDVGGTSKVKDIAVAPAIPQIAVLFTPAAGAQSIITYRADRPANGNTPVTVSGLQGGETLVGIDRRPLNSTVYGVGSTGRVYTLNLANGTATQVPAAAAAFSPLPSGDAGVDFNPSPGAAIRLVTETDQNIAVDTTAGTATAQTTLAYATGDTPNAGMDPNVTGAAYINAVTPAPTPAASQLLYDVDTGVDDLVVQGIRDAAGADLATPAFGNGVLSTIGDLGVTVQDGTGFDITPRFNQQFGAFTPSAISVPIGLPALDGPGLFGVNVASTAAGSPANGGAVSVGSFGGEPTGATVAGMTIVQDNILPAGPTPPVATPTYAIPTTTPTYPIPTVTVTPTPTVKITPGLTIKAKPKTDKRKPFKFTVSGKLNPKSKGRAACSGKIKLTAKKGSKTIGKGKTSVKSNCKYKKTIKLTKKAGKKGKAKITAKFGGNSQLKAKSASTKVKYGKKKRKK